MKEQIKRNLRSKETTELVEIYVLHDENEWSEDAFAAIAEILAERGENLTEYTLEFTPPNDDRASLRIGTFGCTILGLLTGGTFWGFYFAYWARKHQKYLDASGERSSRAHPPYERHRVSCGR